MTISKAAILAQLQKEILPLQGYKKNSSGSALKVLPAAMNNAFPNNEFPLGAVHEFFCNSMETAAATDGFISCIVASLMKDGGACIWVGAAVGIFPPALQAFGIAPDKVIFVHLQKDKDILWAVEEALKCEGIAAVIGEIQELSFTSSRRLQLAVEQSLVTGFIMRRNPRSMNTTACVTRWQITSVPGEMPDDMPGVGFPGWKVELLKVRNGTPGCWTVEYLGGRLCQSLSSPGLQIVKEPQRKIG